MLHPPRLSRKAWEIRRFPFLSHHGVLGYDRIVEELPTIRALARSGSNRNAEFRQFYEERVILLPPCDRGR